MDRLIILFESTHAVIRAEQLCNSAGIQCKAIIVPRHISSDCGIGLELPQDQEATFRDVLENHHVTFTVHRQGKHDF